MQDENLQDFLALMCRVVLRCAVISEKSSDKTKALLSK